MKVSRQQLAEMEADGAKVIRPEPDVVEEEPVEEIEEETDDHEEEERAIRAEESEAMRTLVAQNSEAMKQIGAALVGLKPNKPRDIDFEIIRDEDSESEYYKLMTHIRMRTLIT